MSARTISGINWLKGLDEARKEVRGTDRLVFLFFHHPACGGCKKTIDMTFRDTEVIELIGRDFAPAQFLVTEAGKEAARFKVEWTPTFIIADENLNELERWVGYLPPDEFVSQVHLSEGLAAFHRDRFREAEGAFEWIIDNRPDSDAAPEARYYLGVALYKDTGDASHLERTWEAMNSRYPGSHWTKKASAWAH